MRQESPTIEADAETPPVVELVNKDINIAVKNIYMLKLEESTSIREDKEDIIRPKSKF